jgi:hypothetical protein
MHEVAHIRLRIPFSSSNVWSAWNYAGPFNSCGVASAVRILTRRTRAVHCVLVQTNSFSDPRTRAESQDSICVFSPSFIFLLDSLPAPALQYPIARPG